MYAAGHFNNNDVQKEKYFCSQKEFIVSKSQQKQPLSLAKIRISQQKVFKVRI